MESEKPVVENPFTEEIAKLAEVQAAVLAKIENDKGLFNMGRQAMDNLNITYLLISSLGGYMIQRDEMVDAEVAAGNVLTPPGAESDA